MLRSFITTLGSAFILTASIAAGHADGVTPAPGRLADEAQDTTFVQPVIAPCAPRWQCGTYGCGYRQVCAVPQPVHVPVYYYARPRVYPYGYAYAPRWSYRQRYGYTHRPWRSWHRHNGGHHQNGHRHNGRQHHTWHHHRNWR